jgi:hypothetical protein
MIDNTIKYIICDPINKTYWVRNIHFDTNNILGPVFEVKFTDKLIDATLIDLISAQELLVRFSKATFLKTNNIKVNISNLIIIKVIVTYEVELDV